MLRRFGILKFLIALVLFSITATAAADFELSGDPVRKDSFRWRRTVVPVAFSNSLIKINPAIYPESNIKAAINRSLETWEAAANIEFQISWTDKTTVSPAGVAGDGTSLVTIAQTPENLLMFSGDATEISARTRVFYNRRSEITEADIVFNPYQQFSTEGSPGTFDFESVLTHEIGHLLGLEHSIIPGATMYENQAKNGVFNFSNFSPRTLSEDDIAQIRAIYGAKRAENCCGSIEGKLISANGRSLKTAVVWAEETVSGRVISGVRAKADGSFSIKGLQNGKYRIYLRDSTGNFAGQYLDELEISDDKPVIFTKKINLAPKDFDAQYAGLNGQLSKLAIPINSGKTFQIYIGGKNLKPEDFKVGTTSPFFTVSAVDSVNFDYGRDLSVLTFEIKSLPETPIGEYTIYLQKNDDKTEFLNGILTIEKFTNVWNSPNFE